MPTVLQIWKPFIFALLRGLALNCWKVRFIVINIWFLAASESFIRLIRDLADIFLFFTHFRFFIHIKISHPLNWWIIDFRRVLTHFSSEDSPHFMMINSRFNCCYGGAIWIFDIFSNPQNLRCLNGYFDYHLLIQILCWVCRGF